MSVMQIKVRKTNKFNGIIEVPADKSISHRAVMLASVCKGTTTIKNLSHCEDCENTLKIFQQLGVQAKFKNSGDCEITSAGLKGTDKILYAGNSGTTTRLLSGILAGQNFESRIEGDISLSKRPMKRIIEPLRLMGADISSLNNDFKTPLIIKPAKLTGINYNSPIPSAQVKSCILFAGLFAKGTTSVTEQYISRTHSENMLRYLGANIDVKEKTVSIQKSELISRDLIVPGDISSAAFFCVAATIIPGAEVIIKNVGTNITRTGIIDVLINMGANVEILNTENICGEDVSDIKVSYSENLKGTEIKGELIPRLIDELPVIAILASQADGKTVIKDAQDLRNKESDRIKTVCEEFSKLGVNIEEQDDGFIIYGKTDLKGDTTIDTYHDHRLAMSAYIAGLICEKEICINDFEWVNTSFPEFLKLISTLTEG